MAWSNLEALARVGDCSWSPPVIVRGLCLPQRSAKGNVSGLLVSFVTFYHLVGSCDAFWEARVWPISHRTTWWRGTQRGLACWQAREPRDKSCVITFLLWLIDLGGCVLCNSSVDHIDWLAQYFAPRWYPSNSLLYYFLSYLASLLV
jgi:hypothetical protein